jgi:hypothetical protein
MSRSREKVFSYPCKGAVDIRAHTEAWLSFTFSAGPWVSGFEFPGGSLQVWASSVAEGRRVISFALSLGGWSAADMAAGQWFSKMVTNPDYGRSGTCRLKRNRDGWCVTMRAGRNGPPVQAVAEFLP